MSDKLVVRQQQMFTCVGDMFNAIRNAMFAFGSPMLCDSIERCADELSALARSQAEILRKSTKE